MISPYLIFYMKYRN